MSNLQVADYSIGWICALHEELTAAMAMLDEEHDFLPEQNQDDNNSYVLGRIHQHNVVIACMSDGVDGLVSAATVARDMVRTFPALHFGLLVGIGGGIPNLSQGNDIRLGDVVVSKPDGVYGGVVQYDRGKAKKGGKFVVKGQLDQPPNLLLRTLTNIRARHAKSPAKIVPNIDKAIARNPMLQENGLTYPSEPDCLHCHACDDNIENNNAECEELHVKRKLRRNKNPVVHYGVIASGNQVIKDATVRNHLRDQFGALCVDMEAAGLMNDFPCLVIRGVCDYADSHKNDLWHAYAAITAAAYTKEVLQLISPVQARKEQPIQEFSDLLGKIHETSKAQLDASQARTLEKNTQHEDDRNKQCQRSFKVAPYEVQKNMNPERVAGTCQWVLTHCRYSQWLTKAGKALLWISADPGCGKSVLARSLIDNELQNTDNHTVCYFFFKDNGEQDELSTALCSLLHQLFSRQPQLIRYAMDAWEKNSNKLVKEIYELWRIFLAATADDSAHHVTCVLDAVDECRLVDRPRLVKMLTDFYFQKTSSQSAPRRNHLKFIVTSRPYEDIEVNFRASVEKLPEIRLRGEDENEQIHQEIDLVVRMQVEKLTQDLKLDSPTKKKLTDKLLGMEHRTYLWLYLAIDGIYETHRHSLRPNEAVIETLPSTVEDAYEKILHRVPEAQKGDTKRILQMVVGARRPLTIGEMAIALGIVTTLSLSGPSPVSQHSQPLLRLKKARLKPSWLEENIRHWCGLFVFINHTRIYLIHQTAKEFLIGNEAISSTLPGWKHCLDPSGNEKIMAQVCIAFLCSDYVESMVRGRPRASNKAVGNFLRYSVEHWAAHFRIATPPANDAFICLAFWLCRVDGPLFQFWYTKYQNVVDHFRSERPSSTISCAAKLGQDELLKWMSLSVRDYDANQKDCHGYTALALACQHGHDKVVETLLGQGADIFIEGNAECNALFLATQAGHETIVRTLFEHGADLNGGALGRPLWVASKAGHTKVVQTLLQLGAGVNGAPYRGSKPLYAALEHGHEAVAWILLKGGANVNSVSGVVSPLHLASGKGYEKMVQWLINRGAKINATGGVFATTGGKFETEFWTPLHTAVRYDRAAVVQILLNNFADITIKGEDGTALQMARKFRRTAIADMLKQHIPQPVTRPLKRRHDGAQRTTSRSAKRTR